MRSVAPVPRLAHPNQADADRASRLLGGGRE